MTNEGGTAMYDYFKVFVNNVLNYLDEGVCFTDLNQNILYWNNGAEAITGYRLDEATTQKCYKVITHTDRNGNQQCDKQYPITQVIEKDKLQENFMFIVHKEGHLVPVTIRTFPVHDKDGEIRGFIELISDNSRQKLGQDKVGALTKAAYIDSLSELFSKQYIESRLQTMLTEAPDKKKPFGILYINITGFRVINELYGVSRADKILKMVAKTLSTSIISPNIIGRWHGASFIAIVDTTSKSLLLLLAGKLKTLIAEADFSIGDETIPLKVSVGATMSQSYDTPDYIIERATKASLEEKEPTAVREPITNKAALTIDTQPKNRFHSIRSRHESD
jgi:diguanylate cyclase (GGDEF)-like protein/PAS domain S-box-containing protein